MLAVRSALRCRARLQSSALPAELSLVSRLISGEPQARSTTVLCVRKDGEVRRVTGSVVHATMAQGHNPWQAWTGRAHRLGSQGFPAQAIQGTPLPSHASIHCRRGKVRGGARRAHWVPNPPAWPGNEQVVLIADGQVTQGSTVVKPNVRKTRRIGDHVIGGFAGAVDGSAGRRPVHRSPLVLRCLQATGTGA